MVGSFQVCSKVGKVLQVNDVVESKMEQFYLITLDHPHKYWVLIDLRQGIHGSLLLVGHSQRPENSYLPSYSLKKKNTIFTNKANHNPVDFESILNGV